MSSFFISKAFSFLLRPLLGINRRIFSGGKKVQKISKSKIEIKLNPKLDPLEISKAFADRKWCQIPEILEPESAESIFQVIKNQVPWHLIFNDGLDHHSIPPEKLENLTREEAMGLHRFVINGAREGFQFFYQAYPLFDHMRQGINRDFSLNAFHDFLHSKALTAFIRKIAGLTVPFHAYSQVTSFGPGHFLNYHTDRNDSEKRLLAYVFNFTRGWKAEWGGALHFLDQNQKIKTTLNPTFNSLNIFQVPKDHLVQFVSPFAEKKRYAISGWFRENV